MPAPPAPRPVAVRRSRVRDVMFVPILSAEDGYGFTYGAQFAFAGHRSHAAPHRRAGQLGRRQTRGVEYQQEFSKRFAPRLRTGGLLQRRTHPFFEDDADRKRVWGRTELADRPARFTPAAKSPGSTRRSTARKYDATSIGADVVVDTRVDPLMPHNAIFVRCGGGAALLFAIRHGGENRNRREWLHRVVSRDRPRPPRRPRRHQPAGTGLLQVDARRIEQSPRVPRRLRRRRYARRGLGGDANTDDARRFAWRDSGTVSSWTPAPTYDKGERLRRSETGEGRWRRNLG